MQLAKCLGMLVVLVPNLKKLEKQDLNKTICIHPIFDYSL